jgi:hypothetical protein
MDLIEGELKLGEYSFSSITTIDLLKAAIFPFELEPWSSNDNWNSFRIFYDDLIVILFFKSNFLKVIEIYKTDVKNSLGVSGVIEKIGGEGRYLWGSIELNQDIKGGYESVLIKYL